MNQHHPPKPQRIGARLLLAALLLSALPAALSAHPALPHWHPGNNPPGSSPVRLLQPSPKADQADFRCRVMPWELNPQFVGFARVDGRLTLVFRDPRSSREIRYAVVPQSIELQTADAADSIADADWLQPHLERQCIFADGSRLAIDDFGGTYTDAEGKARSVPMTPMDKTYYYELFDFDEGNLKRSKAKGLIQTRDGGVVGRSLGAFCMEDRALVVLDGKADPSGEAARPGGMALFNSADGSWEMIWNSLLHRYTSRGMRRHINGFTVLLRDQYLQNRRLPSGALQINDDPFGMKVFGADVIDTYSDDSLFLLVSTSGVALAVRAGADSPWIKHDYRWWSTIDAEGQTVHQLLSNRRTDRPGAPSPHRDAFQAYPHSPTAVYLADVLGIADRAAFYRDAQAAQLYWENKTRTWPYPLEDDCPQPVFELPADILKYLPQKENP